MAQIKEIKIPNCNYVYRIVEINDEGCETETGRYRFRRRIKDRAGRWTMSSGTFDSLAEAKQSARRSIAQLETLATDRATAPKPRIFADAFKKFMHHKEFEQKVSKGTLQGYENRYAHMEFFKPVPMSSITPKVVDGWIDLILDPRYLATQQGSRINYAHEYKILSTFLNYYRNFEDESFVVPLLKRHRIRARGRSKHEADKIRFLSVEEEEMLFAKGPRTEAIRDLMLFQLHTGTRVGEAAALEFRNIDFRRREVRIAQHLFWDRKDHSIIELLPGTKSGPTRVIPLTDDCLSMLRRRKAATTSSTTFEYDRGGWLPYRTIQSQYDAAFRKLEIDLSGTHVLRHTFAVRFLDQTKDIYALQRLLGHADLKMTQVYAKYSNESVRRSFQLFRGGQSDENSRVVSPFVSRATS